MKTILIPAAFVAVFVVLYHTAGEEVAVGLTIFIGVVIAAVRWFARVSEAREE